LFSFPKKTKNPNPSPIEKRFGFSWFGATGRIRTSGLPGRRTTTGVYRPTINRKFCQVCPTVPKTRKSLLLVVTTGFFGVLKGNCTVVVKWWSKYRESTFSKKKEFAKWVLDNTILAEKTLYSR